MVSSRRTVRITIMIVSKPLDVIWRGWVIEKESTLVEIISDDGDVALRSINKHLQWKDGKLW